MYQYPMPGRMIPDHAGHYKLAHRKATSFFDTGMASGAMSHRQVPQDDTLTVDRRDFGLRYCRPLERSPR
jgi:hypothetical protein